MSDTALSYEGFVVRQNDDGRWQAYDSLTDAFVGKSYRSEHRCAEYLHQLMREHRPEIMRFILTGSTKP